MKNLKPLLAALVLLVCTANSYSQETAPLTEPNYNKPKLFESLPGNIKVNINTLKELLNSSTGEVIASNFGAESDFSFNGQVVSTTSKNNNTIQNVVIRSADFNGASLSFTRITKEDGSTGYTGRILSFQHGDAYELQFKDGNYEFVKKKFHQIINE